LALQLLPSPFDWLSRRCREKLNEKNASVSGDARIFDLLGLYLYHYDHNHSGPPERVTGEKVVSFSDLSNLQLHGQTVSLDLIFSGNNFVRLFKSTNSSFLLLPMLDVFGAGTINNPTGSGYLFDEAGNPISSVTSFGGSVTTDPGRGSFPPCAWWFLPAFS
jgi:hypothetical protein